MSDFFFIPLGVGDAFSALYYSSCYALHAGGRWLLVDCPHPIRKILREAGETAGLPLDVDRFDGLLLSHLHADHCTGLEGYGYYYHFGLKRKAALYTHPHNAALLWEDRLRPSMGELVMPTKTLTMRMDDYFEVHHLTEEAPTTIGPFTVEIHPTVHLEGTTAFRITAGGRTLGLSIDTSYHLPLIEWLAESDFVVHETNYGAHTPYEKLLALPQAIRSKMRLVHYPDDFDCDASEIECLRQGHRYNV